MTDATLLLRHARELLTLDADLDPRDPWSPASLGIIPDGAVAVCGDRVVAVGPTLAVERAISLRPNALVLDVGDALLVPGLVDPHTHALFAGDRAGEFSQRVRGDGYADIAARGGGIASTVRAVRGSDDATLAAGLRARLDRMRAYGTTTVEVKTGYALDLAHELRCLEVLGAFPEVVPTFLPLHAVPPERRGEADGRARFLADALGWLPAVLAQGRARFVDAYIDRTGFSVDEARPLLERARDGGLCARLHLGQFADVGGAALAASLGAASADHLEHLDDDGARALAGAGVVGGAPPGRGAVARAGHARRATSPRPGDGPRPGHRLQPRHEPHRRPAAHGHARGAADGHEHPRGVARHHPRRRALARPPRPRGDPTRRPRRPRGAGPRVVGGPALRLRRAPGRDTSSWGVTPSLVEKLPGLSALVYRPHLWMHGTL
jgi:imidazolonepropionase